ncbi:MAG: CBS domain-containing protein [Luteibacter sp.]
MAVDVAASLQDALAAMLAQGRDRLPVEEDGRAVGAIHLADLVAARR